MISEDLQSQGGSEVFAKQSFRKQEVWYGAFRGRQGAVEGPLGWGVTHSVSMVTGLELRGLI